MVGRRKKREWGGGQTVYIGALGGIHYGGKEVIIIAGLGNR